MNTSLQVKNKVWRKAFSCFLKEKGISPSTYYVGSVFPTDEWEHDEWYKDQLLFDEACGLRRNWLDDYDDGGLSGYWIADEKKFLLARIKYGI
jgi:hypothetical protein